VASRHEEWCAALGELPRSVREGTRRCERVGRCCTNDSRRTCGDQEWDEWPSIRLRMALRQHWLAADRRLWPPRGVVSRLALAPGRAYAPGAFRIRDSSWRPCVGQEQGDHPVAGTPSRSPARRRLTSREGGLTAEDPGEGASEVDERRGRPGGWYRKVPRDGRGRKCVYPR